jgi:hypothetical protein
MCNSSSHSCWMIGEHHNVTSITVRRYRKYTSPFRRPDRTSAIAATETVFAAFDDRINHPEFRWRTSGQTGCGATLSPALPDSGLSTPLRTGQGC